MPIALRELAGHEVPVGDQAADLERRQQLAHRIPEKRLDRCAPDHDIRTGPPHDRLRQAPDGPLQIPGVERLEMVANRRGSIDLPGHGRTP
jgi:hypothetical protein